jgi:luciferase family oxidoreductase group 1
MEKMGKNFKIKLSALETGILTFDLKPTEAIEDSKKLIKELESLGYYRFWLSEHHESHYSWTKPNLMIPYLAAHTSSIRLGSAAVLMGLYPPLQVAEDYRTLAAMFPNRIDYGLCSAVPSCTDSRTALLDGEELSFAEVAQKFELKLIEMHKYLHNDFPAGHRFEKGATPTIPAGDDTWIMGTGMGSAILAAKHSFSFSYSLFHKRSLQEANIVKHYHTHFISNYNKNKPSFNIAVSVICDDDIKEVLVQKNWIDSLKSEFQVNIIGTPESCCNQIVQLCEEYETNEVVIYMMWHIYEKRVNAFKQLSKCFENVSVECAV